MGKKKDLEILKSLIEKGEKLLDKSKSVKGGGFNDPTEYERIGSGWYIQSINFLSTRFGPSSIQVRKFASYFGKYTSTNFLGMYGGTVHFVKEDVQKGLGHLEGMYDSLSKGYIKRINPFFRGLYKLWLEIKELLNFFKSMRQKT